MERNHRIVWARLDAEQWLTQMDKLMAKPTKNRKEIGRSEFLKTTKLSRIQSQEVVQFFDPLPTEVKRESAAAFRAYLERRRRALNKPATPRSKKSRRTSL